MRFLVMLLSLFLMNQSVQAQSNLNELTDPSGAEAKNRGGNMDQKSVLLCTLPSKPTCVNSVSPDDSYDYCSNNVERYIERLAEYQSCIMKETTEQLHELVEAYTCRLKAKTICPYY